MSTIGEHLKSSQVAFLEYVRGSERRLGESIAQREPIYLDTKFWILMRNASRGKETSNTVALLTLLKQAVNEGKVFCPISSALFVELMRQDSLRSRMETAKTIDDLSLGITIVGFEERTAVEMDHLIRSTANLNSHHSIHHAVWRKLGYVLGISNVQNAAIDPKIDLAVQKAFFDHMCAMSLQDMIKTIGEEWALKENPTAFALRMNEQIAEHAQELRSFKQAYDAEVRGVVDDVGDIALDVVRSIAREYRQRVTEMDDGQQKEAKNRWKNLIYLTLVQDKARYFLPTLHIRASLYASLRWNKGRKFRPTDLWDFSHAEVALGYCSAFFTEKSLHSMITEKHLGLDALYACHVCSSVEHAIEHVSGILRAG